MTTPTSPSQPSPEAQERAYLSDLLAVIHRDGGHYEEQYGVTKAFEDALEKLESVYLPAVQASDATPNAETVLDDDGQTAPPAAVTGTPDAYKVRCFEIARLINRQQLESAAQELATFVALESERETTALAAKVAELEADRDSADLCRRTYEEHYENLFKEKEAACKLVADMHAAAVGEIRGPILGVVEDVAELRAQLAASEQRYRELEARYENKGEAK